jgi:acetylornithine deacetylase
MPKNYSPREMLERLVSFPTVSRESNLPLIDFVEEYLGDHGVTSHRVYNEDGTKANLYAHIGPMVDGGVVLSGHTDVVPVDGQNWSTDPFTVTEKDGLLYGRGTCDMKGFNALALAHVPQMLAADLKRPVQIALSYDEEVGCLGAPPMIADMVGLPKAAAVVVGEPSMMKVVSCHKGSIGITTHVRGFEVHSSLMHTGVSAIMTAARLIEWLSAQTHENMAKPVAEGDALFDPPFTTLHVGLINGGTASNITAKDCEFSCDIRCVSSEDPDYWLQKYTGFAAQVEAEIQKIQPEAAISLTPHHIVPGLKPEENGAAETLVRRLTGDNTTGAVSYGTEGGQFQDGGYSTVICGPGSIEQAHQADEFISIDQFNQGAQFVRDLIKHLSH